MYFKKKETARKTKSKEPQKPITTYFSETTVKGLCTFYKDLEELYFDWLKVRAERGKFAEFTSVAEKSAWKQL
ncbi:MAG: hypothetical protein GY932_15310 [Arcobacter sp.]|nr:hypothetical protein [Arcobacter sp.]